MKKDDVFLNLFFNKKEVAKIKKVDKLHSRKLMDISKLNGYIIKYRITSNMAEFPPEGKFVLEIVHLYLLLEE